MAAAAKTNIHQAKPNLLQNPLYDHHLEEEESQEDCSIEHDLTAEEIHINCDLNESLSLESIADKKLKS